jgi:hypothetical protein
VHAHQHCRLNLPPDHRRNGEQPVTGIRQKHKPPPKLRQIPRSPDNRRRCRCIELYVLCRIRTCRLRLYGVGSICRVSLQSVQ